MEARIIAAAAFAFATSVPLPGADMPAKPQVLMDKLRKHLETLDRDLEGVLGVVIRDLTSGSSLELRGRDTFPSASTIKLAILYELYRQAEEGRVDLSAVVQPSSPRVAEGVLERLSFRVSLTVRDLAVLMMGWSDNEATNELVRRLGQERVNERLASLGLSGTRLRRLMMDLEAARRGEENVSTPAELARLVEILFRGEGLRPESAHDLLALSSKPEAGAWLRSGLPGDVKALAKSGSLEGTRSEAAYVDLPGRPYSLAIMTAYLRRDSDGEAAIRQISAAVHSTFDRLARSSEYGRVISAR
jgi:beta-lactamase class A